MVSSSTLLAPSSSLPNNWKHHVFPSFHGSDVRTNFLSHVLKEFKRKGIDSFIDNDIDRGELIGTALVEAIRGSRIAIVLLSKNYASSTWCLNELVEIMKCREELGQTVMSIFYQVDPTDVKKQTGDFGKVFEKTCKGKTEEEIKRWKHDLTEVAQIAGFHTLNRKTESEMIEDIAIDVSNKLNLSAPCSDFDGLVGMESNMKEMRPLLQLDSKEVRIVGILGPPGIGKTTIARSLFNQHSQDFQLSIFMDNIKTKYARPVCSDEYSVKLYLQEQFISQLTNEKDTKIPHLGIAKDRLKHKKVLVVLDDVDRSVQLEAMAKETSWFGPGSRIIITTQDENVLKASGIDHIHRVSLPSNDEALQIFCIYAFGKKKPRHRFRELACEVIRLVGELPLGLKVMGSYFRGRSEQNWIEELPRLKTHLDRNGEIASILKFSYNALNDEDKSLFLHIACFFSGEPVDTVEGCLEKCFNVRQGLRVLSEKSLISTGYGSIHMAKLLILLGKKIARKEHGRREFLNNASDIDEVLSGDKAGNSSVIGINFDSDEEIKWTSRRAFERLSNLQFLRIFGKGVNPQSMNYISQKLKVLIWPFFRMSCFPSSFNPEFLVHLHLGNSDLKKLWKAKKPLNNLKLMDLNSSRRLKELPDLSTATNLYDLNLSYCPSLVKLPSSIGNAYNLQILSLRYCSSLVEIPSTIENAFHLKILNLDGCSRLVELPSSIWNLVHLEELNLKYCSSLVELPSIENAINLRKLDLNDCSRLLKLPSSIGNAINLEELNLNYCSNLVELPSSMRKLGRLWRLELKECSKLEVILANINLESIGELDLSGCYLLKSDSTDIHPWIRRISRLRGLVISGKKKLPDSLGEHLSDCSLLKSDHESSTDIQELASWMERMSRLRRLVLRGIKKLVSLPQLPYSVVELDASNCVSLERLDCSFRNPNILLNFKNCIKLNQEARDLIIQTPTNRYAVFPCGDVPQYFTYRSHGCSLTVKLNQMPLGKYIKFKVCIIHPGEVKNDFRERSDDAYVCCSITSGGNDLTACYKKVKEVLTGHLYTFEIEVETEEVTSNELVFEFDICNSTYYTESMTYRAWNVEGCGILQLLEVPLLSFRDVVEDYEPSDSELAHEDDDDDKRLLLL